MITIIVKSVFIKLIEMVTIIIMLRTKIMIIMKIRIIRTIIKKL